jgi:hypothetical protein
MKAMGSSETSMEFQLTTWPFYPGRYNSALGVVEKEWLNQLIKAPFVEGFCVLGCDAM